MSHRERQGVGHEANATAPDLASPSGSAFTPPALASALWNHTPAMWSEISAKVWLGRRWYRPIGRTCSRISMRNRFSNSRPIHGGDKRFSVRRRCADCHAARKLVQPSLGPGPPVSAWKKVNDPATLAVPDVEPRFLMIREGVRLPLAKGIGPSWMGGTSWISPSTFSTYKISRRSTQFSLPEAASGKIAVSSITANGVMKVQLALETRLANKTFLDIAAGVWNHVPLMGAGAGVFPTVPEGDMRKILAYVWDLQYRGPEGNVARGELAFAAKGCAGCHSDAGTRAVVSPHPGKVFTPFSMAAIAWGSSRRCIGRCGKGDDLAHPLARRHFRLGRLSELLGSEVRTATCKYQCARRV